MVTLDVSPAAGRPTPTIFDMLKSESESVLEKATLLVANHRREEAEFSRSVLVSARGNLVHDIVNHMFPFKINIFLDILCFLFSVLCLGTCTCSMVA
jgi:hypothetical protein